MTTISIGPATPTQRRWELLSSLLQVVTVDDGSVFGALDIDSSGNLAVTGLQAPSGIDLAALDDYDEGTWTPVLTTSSGHGTPVYITQSGYYVALGGWMWVAGDIHLSAWNRTAGNAQITGLPQAAAHLAGSFAISTIEEFDVAGLSRDMLGMFVGVGGTTISFRANSLASTGAPFNVAASRVGDDARIIFSGGYPI